MSVSEADDQASASTGVAREIFQRWIATDPLAHLESDLPVSMRDAYRAKWRLYREATILWLLLPPHQDEALYADVLREFELLILPPKADAQGLAKWSQLDAARKDFAELLDRANSGRGGELDWASHWFAEVGGITNPVTLTSFVSQYLDFWRIAAKTLDDLVARLKGPTKGTAETPQNPDIRADSRRMGDQIKAALILGAALIVAALLNGGIYQISGRLSSVGGAYRLNRITGSMSLILVNHKMPVTAVPVAAHSEPTPVKLHQSDFEPIPDSDANR